MNRREILKAGLVVAAIAAVGAKSPQYAIVEVITDLGTEESKGLMQAHQVTVVEWPDLKKGDMFRLRDPDTGVLRDGGEVCEALSDGFWNDFNGERPGTWAVKVETPERLRG